MDELIAHWQNFLDALDDGCVEFNDSGMRSMAKRTIEALKPVEDAEVQDWIKYKYSKANSYKSLGDALDIIERLARDKDQAELDDHNEIIDRERQIRQLEERIEELENRPHDEVLLHDMELMQTRIEELEKQRALLEANNFPHAKPYMVCVPTEIWKIVFSQPQEVPADSDSFIDKYIEQEDD